jgi:hypothetical protein
MKFTQMCRKIPLNEYENYLKDFNLGSLRSKNKIDGPGICFAQKRRDGVVKFFHQTHAIEMGFVENIACIAEWFAC